MRPRTTISVTWTIFRKKSKLQKLFWSLKINSTCNFYDFKILNIDVRPEREILNQYLD